MARSMRSFSMIPTPEQPILGGCSFRAGDGDRQPIRVDEAASGFEDLFAGDPGDPPGILLVVIQPQAVALDVHQRAGNTLIRLELQRQPPDEVRLIVAQTPRRT